MTSPLDIAAFRAINSLAGKHRWLDAIGFFCARWLVVAMFMATALRAYVLLSGSGTAAAGDALAAAGVRGGSAAVFAFIASAFASLFLFRARPYKTLPNVTLLMGDPVTTYSFPSSHASASFALAFAVCAVDPVFGGVLLVAAGLVGLGRVFVGVHYPSDVLAGAALGWAATWAVGNAGAV